MKTISRRRFMVANGIGLFGLAVLRPTRAASAEESHLRALQNGVVYDRRVVDLSILDSEALAKLSEPHGHEVLEAVLITPRDGKRFRYKIRGRADRESANLREYQEQVDAREELTFVCEASWENKETEVIVWFLSSEDASSEE